MATINACGNGLSGTTGTGLYVGQTSPSLITPTLGSALATSIQISNTGIIDTNGKVALAFSATASAVNAFTIFNSPTTISPTLQCTGSDSNISFLIKSKGTGSVIMYDGSANIIARFLPNTSGVNYLGLYNGATGIAPAITAIGTDSNIGITIQPKGTGAITLLDGNGNTLLTTVTTATAVNYFTLTNAATAGSPTINAIGSDSNIILTMAGKGTGGVTLKGTTAADSAAAGYVGEELDSANATGVAMSNATVTQIQTLSLTAGDWDVWATFYTTVTGTTVNSIVECQLHTSTATIAAPTTAQLASIASLPGLNVTGQATYLNTGISRWNVSGATTVYLNATATYSASTLTGNGMIHARRIR